MIQVSYQGEPGAFSEEAATSFFGTRARLKPREQFKDVFSFATAGSGRLGIVPIENSVHGSVHEIYDLLMEHNLFITGEITLRIHHHLMTFPGAKLNDIRFVYSHPQALGQCAAFLRKFGKVKTVAYYDTAGAAKMIREERRKDAAAIASTQAARTYKLKVVRRNIETNHHNYTRFIALSRRSAPPLKVGKTSLVFAAQNIPGALFKALAVFALRDINLLKIESRPLLGKPWEYLFYLDISGSVREEKVRAALNHLGEVSTFLRVFGSYPTGTTIQG